MKFSAVPLAAAILFPVASFAQEGTSGADNSRFVYIGTYTRGESEGIYVFRMDPQTGKWGDKKLAAEVENPSFLALHPNGRFLYAVGEMAAGGTVSAFAIDSASGELALLNQQPSGGGGPCHVSVDPSGRTVLVANYGGGSVSTFPLQEDGKLGEQAGFQQHRGTGPNADRQKGPHAHSIHVDPSGKFALAADLGIDRVRVYRVTEDGGLKENDPSEAALAGGAGPRHLAFHRGKGIAYVINELNSSVTAFSFDAENGELTEKQTVSTLPEDFDGTNWPAEVLVHPSGQFLYGSNRGHDSIVIYRIEADGRLTLAGHESTRGKNPRNFGIDPSGQFLFVAHQDSDDIVAFGIDPESGDLTPTGDSYSVSMPVCVRFR